MKEILEKVKRRYFEVFGDLEKEIQFLRKTNLYLVGTIFCMFLSLFFLGMKPPVVIRVSQVAEAEAIKDLPINNKPTEYEVISFAKRFITRYTAFNSYTISRDLTDAFNLMTSRLQKESKRSLLDSGLIDKLKDAGVDTEIEFKEAKVERDAMDASTVSLVGVRKITKYQDPNFHEEILFRSDLVLKKVTRSISAPDGLLVEAYREMTLNDLTKGNKKHD